MSFAPPDRRSLLVGGAAAALLPGKVGAAARTSRTAFLSPFTLGVASGDPLPDGFVLWTRLAPDPLAADGLGGLNGEVVVKWRVAADEAMTRVVAAGHAAASPVFAHSIHVEVAGLLPGRPYWYDFTSQGHRSPTGTTRTAPAPGGGLQHLRIAMASCAHWELGFFSAYRHMAEEHPDLVLFLGDYIYEYNNGPQSHGAVVRRHATPGDARDLAGYRLRYAQHRTDPDLQGLHAAAPCLITWDDHEVQNDYANRWSEFADVPAEVFLRRRAAAYRAFYEHMPLRRQSLPHGPDMRVYDRLRFGDLVQIDVLDGRQYRTPQPCPMGGFRGGHVAPDSCTELTDPSRTMLGLQQEQWLYDGFRAGGARWNLMAQDLLVASLLQADKTGAPGHYTDGWDGYQANRTRMLQAIDATGLRNPVFLGGDIHSFWATDLKLDSSDPASRTVATEFVGTSISQKSPPASAFPDIQRLNPHVRYVDPKTNGYVALDLTAERIDVRFQAISDRRDPQATAATLQRFTVEDGRPGVGLA